MATVESAAPMWEKLYESIGEDTRISPSAELGEGWKAEPCIVISPGETMTLADIEGPGAIEQIWMTLLSGPWRFSVLRIYWDEQEQPSVECPLGDFFALGWGQYAPLSSLAICVNPTQAFNCYWEMPFQRRARITLTNVGPKAATLFYQVNYELREISEDAAYFHAQFRRVNPVPYGEVFTILDGVQGQGQYVGTYLAWGSNNNGWWGEGEIKFYLDGDEWPTICGTGTEDYFCGSHSFHNSETHKYEAYTTPYAGFHLFPADGELRSQQRFGMYRWHITDPVRFQQDLRVTIQALGWRSEHNSKLLPLQDDIASVAYWYQTLPTSPFPELPDRDYLEVI